MGWTPRFVVGRIGDHNVGPLMRALVSINLHYLARHPETPTIYASGVRYERDRPGTEDWLTVDQILARRPRVADCKSLAAWRVAELQLRGERARAAWSKRCRDSGCLYHIFVRRGDGRTEDPSEALGMR